MSKYLEYVSDSDYNFKVSLLNVPETVNIFSRLDQQLTEMIEYINKLPEVAAERYVFFLGTFIVVAQREMRNGYSLFLRSMSYDGLLLLRIAIEAAIFAYRIFKEPELLEVWANRNEDWKTFKQKFVFAELPHDIPFRAELDKNRDLIGDYWAHPNVNYFSNAVEIKGDQIRVHFFDRDEKLYHLYLLSFLDASLKVLAVFRMIVGEAFKVFASSTDAAYERLVTDFGVVKEKYRPRTGT